MFINEEIAVSGGGLEKVNSDTRTAIDRRDNYWVTSLLSGLICLEITL